MEVGGVLFVSGRRRLAARIDPDRPSPGETWVRERLREAFDTLRPLAYVSGDAPGPDTWGREEADLRLIPTVIYSRDGYLYVRGKRADCWAERLGFSLGAERDKRWFLGRDRYMAERVAHLVARGHSVYGRAYLDPPVPGEKNTFGTEYTVRVARELGIEFETETFFGGGRKVERNESPNP